MSEENLKLELEQCKNQINGMNVQLGAAKEMIGENLNAILTLKTNLGLYQKSHNELAQNNKKLIDENANLQAQNQVMAAKILELTTPKPEVVESVCEPEPAAEQEVKQDDDDAGTLSHLGRMAS